VNDEQKEFVRKGFQSTERMISIVNDLLSIDKMESDKPDFHFQPKRLEDIIESVRGEFDNQAQSKQIALTFKKTTKPLPEIEVDEIKLRMVLENFIDNAIKYTPKGGAVTVALDDTGLNTASNTVKVSITDTGIGITEADKPKIFSKFYRAPSAVGVEPDGSGLGLFIAKDIVERHGGTVWFDTEAGKGTTFNLTLPVHQKKV
ncbi:MAG TPA: HAMP domain-containing sensor histidine kinase, partial [Candidatus Paceibacterota bacterium]|nr:HAMP domain-containing sensor histidine kinase [Candidatus Paceibacterota bacterium]